MPIVGMMVSLPILIGTPSLAACPDKPLSKLAARSASATPGWQLVSGLPEIPPMPVASGEQGGCAVPIAQAMPLSTVTQISPENGDGVNEDTNNNDTDNDANDGVNDDTNDAEVEGEVVNDEELGILRLREPQSRIDDDELGVIRLRPPENLPPLETEPPPPPPPATGFLVGQANFLGGSNLFRSVDPIDERIFQTGVGFYVFPQISSHTTLFAGVEGNLVRYSRFPVIDYNEVQLQGGIRQRFNDKLLAQLSWRNQNLYTLEGDEFFSNGALEFLVSRRDILSNRIWLDSYYQARLNFSQPTSFSRFSQLVGLSFNYGFTPAFRAGLNYQVFLDDYTRIGRHDTYHQVLGQLSYNFSPNNRLNLFVGGKFGNSSDPTVDFDDFIYGLGLNVSLPLF
jgi:hypothetical protein